MNRDTIADDKASSTGKRSRAAVVLGLVPLGIGLTIALATAIAHLAWPLDLIAMLMGPAWIGLGIVCAGVFFVLRMGKHGMIMLLTAAFVASQGWWGRQLLPLPETLIEHEGQMVVRVLQTNLHSKWNPTPEDGLRALARSGADVVVITEFQLLFFRELRRDSELSRAYPHFTTREWVRDRVPGCIVMSRWPIERLESGDGLDHEQVFVGRVQTPAGPMIVAQIPPDSPRTWPRWTRGGAITKAAREVLEPYLEQGMPVALAADLNGTPFGSRSRHLRRGGLVESKPALVLGGTWPTGKPRVLQLAIDDVWTGGGARAVAWRRVHLPGSDHLGAEAGILIPAGGGSFSGLGSPDSGQGAGSVGR